MASFVPPTLASEAVFHIGSFAVRNTMITAVMTICLWLVVGLLVRKKKYAMVPGGIQNFIAVITEGWRLWSRNPFGKLEI